MANEVAPHTPDLRSHILNEIRRIAALSGGKPPGKRTFLAETGLKEGAWSGRYWARWGDALEEAGYPANKLNEKLDSLAILIKLAQMALELGRLPTRPEMRLRRREDLSFPGHSTISNHYPTNQHLLLALRNLSAETKFTRVKLILPGESEAQRPAPSVRADGFVYLLRSGDYFEVGRSDNVERRIREISVALPDTVVLVHAIRTDDPPGMEAYWHRRFAERRANGEWFRLEPDDVKSFRRRTFQ